MTLRRASPRGRSRRARVPSTPDDRWSARHVKRSRRYYGPARALSEDLDRPAVVGTATISMPRRSASGVDARPINRQLAGCAGPDAPAEQTDARELLRRPTAVGMTVAFTVDLRRSLAALPEPSSPSTTTSWVNRRPSISISPNGNELRVHHSEPCLDLHPGTSQACSIHSRITCFRHGTSPPLRPDTCMFQPDRRSTIWESATNFCASPGTGASSVPCATGSTDGSMQP